MRDAEARETGPMGDAQMSEENRRQSRSGEELERRVDAHNELVRIQAWVDEHRAKALAKPLPRNECPGCFAAIYELAAAQGWCCDCYGRHEWIAIS